MDRETEKKLIESFVKAGKVTQCESTARTLPAIIPSRNRWKKQQHVWATRCYKKRKEQEHARD